MKPRTFAFSPFCSPDLGIDLGTTHTQVWVAGAGIALDEPSIVAVQNGSRRVLNHGQAVGNLAKIMHGRTPDSFQTIRPIRDGVVADFEVCEQMLRYFIRKARPRSWGAKPRVLIAVPSEVTPVERQAVLTTAQRAGARQVYLMDKAKAAGLGARLPLAEPVGSMVCDLGGGTTEIAVLCLGDVAVSESLRIAGEEIDRAIMDYLRRKHMLRIGEQMAERIKVEIGAAAALEPVKTLAVRGCDVVTGLPRQTVLTSEEVREAIETPVQSIVEAIGRTLGRCHPELSADLMENGMVLAGGGSQCCGLDRRLSQATGMPVRVAPDPLTCVVRGLGICLEHLDAWHHLIQHRRAA